MKSFLAGVAAAIVIAVAAGVLMSALDMTSADQYTTANVRR